MTKENREQAEMYSRKYGEHQQREPRDNARKNQRQEHEAAEQNFPRKCRPVES